MTEIWKDIPGYEGLYQASSYGRIKRLAAIVPWATRCGNPGTRTIAEKIMTPQIHPRARTDGHYLHTSIGGRQFLIHRLVAMAFHPNPEGRPIVRHLDGDATNNRVGNLAWGTLKENSQDMKAHGNSCFGERSATAKLTRAQVLEIKQIGSSVSQDSLAEKYGVCQTQISRILLGTRWSHVHV